MICFVIHFLCAYIKRNIWINWQAGEVGKVSLNCELKEIFTGWKVRRSIPGPKNCEDVAKISSTGQDEHCKKFGERGDSGNNFWCLFFSFKFLWLHLLMYPKKHIGKYICCVNNCWIKWWINCDNFCTFPSDIIQGYVWIYFSLANKEKTWNP